MNRPLAALTAAAAVTVATACLPTPPPPAYQLACVPTADRLVRNRCVEWVFLAPDIQAGSHVVGPANEGYFHQSHGTARVLEDPNR